MVPRSNPMASLFGTEFFDLWDNPEDYISLEFEERQPRTFSIRVVVDAPSCPRLSIDMIPIKAGQA